MTSAYFSREVLFDAAMRFLADTLDLPEELDVNDPASSLRMAAAWLDFYDALIHSTDLNLDVGPECNDLQEELRRIADTM